MAFIRLKCNKCGKTVLETQRMRVGAKVFITYDCGHSIISEVLGALDETKSADAVQAELDAATKALEVPKHPAELLFSSDGKALYPFQINTVKVIEHALFNLGLKGFLVGHEMGLGKTPISLILLRIYLKQMGPCLMIVKSALKVQFFQECLRWIGPEYIPQIIETARDRPDRGFDLHIIGIDLVRRMGTRLEEYGYKTIIIDECQLIKNTEAQRTKGIRLLCDKAKYVLALSGTAIKNHAGEYFSILNMIAPYMFNSKFAFYQNECKSEYKNGIPKPGGLRNPDEFFYKTRNFILRYEREEVMPELPICSRSFRYCDLGKEVSIAYERTLEEFCDYMETSQDSGIALYTNTLAYLSKMRHLTGLAKVDAAIDYVMEFLGSRENDDKLTIFMHHKDVGYTLHAALTPICEELECNPPIMFTGDLDSTTRAEVVKAFKDEPKNRTMICSTLAGGEGLNLQFCHDFVLLERQWNPANEEQAEARFIRIGQQSSKVSGTYIVAVGTIDEFFAELVERKRSIMKQTLDGKDVRWEEQSIIKELGEQLYRSGRSKKWRY